MPYIRIEPGININNEVDNNINVTNALNILKENGYIATELTAYDALVEVEVNYDLENYNTLEEDEISNLTDEQYTKLQELIYEELDVNFERMLNLEYMRSAIRDCYNIIINNRD